MEPIEPEEEQQWTGRHLLISALVQLLLVHIAYKIDRSKSVPYLSTASWAILFGIAFGALLSLMSKKRASGTGLDPQILFFGLLPPIILEAGFNTQRKGFFSNFSAILLLALLGTIVATIATAGGLLWLGRRFDFITELKPAEALLYGSLISAIDPVATLVVLKKSRAPNLLFNLLFGESVLNDAVSIVISGLFQRSVLEKNDSPLTWRSASELAGELIGIGVSSVALSATICLASAFILKVPCPLALHELIELHTNSDCVPVLIALGCRDEAVPDVRDVGDSAVGVCELRRGRGLRAQRPTLRLLQRRVHPALPHVQHLQGERRHVHALALDARVPGRELYLHVPRGQPARIHSYANADPPTLPCVIVSNLFKWDWGFIGASFGVCLVARALNTFPLCALANLCRRQDQRIPVTYMTVIWFSGLRGSIAFALALNVRVSGSSDHADILRASTLFTVLSTTILFGMATGPLLRMLQLSQGVKRDQHHHGNTNTNTSDEASLLIEEAPESLTVGGVVGNLEYGSVRELWVALDETHLKPLFGGKPRQGQAPRQT